MRAKKLQMQPNDYKLFPQVVNPDSLGATDRFKYINSGVGYLVMLDRYSQRDNSLKTLRVGDIVVAEAIPHEKYPTQCYGVVKALEGDFTKRKGKVTISIEYPEALTMPDGTILTDEDMSNFVVSQDKVFKPLEIYWEQISARVAKGVASVELTEALRTKYEEEFYWMLKNTYAVPGGRILYGAGANLGVTLFNCFVLPSVPDSRKGISNHRGTVMDIMSHGGGNGSDITTLRPQGALVQGVNGFSSGAVSWGDDLSRLTNLVIQGGSRRGAQMISMLDSHPDIISFILCKIQNPYVLDKIIKTTSSDLIRTVAERYLVRDLAGKPMGVADINYMTGANISVLVTDDLMEAVESDSNWNLRFPDIENFTEEDKEYYDANWQTIRDVRKWEALGKPSKTYYTLKAREVWDLINTAARYSAEPGVIFIDTCEKESNSYYYANLVTTNPCGEQPLPPYAVCNLIAINALSMYDKELKDINYTLLEKVTRISQRFADNVIDHTPYFLEENEKMALGERRVGKGLMGLGDLMIKLKLPYGSDEMLDKTDEFTGFIATMSYRESALIAKEKGSFPYFDKDKYLESGFVKRLDNKTREMIAEYGIRNVCSITEAPTGSTGTMVGVSTGIEPNFAFKYYRSGRLGKFVEVYTNIAEEYFKEHPQEKELPSYFTAAMDLSPLDHVKVQSVIQKHCDSAISKTCNAPSDFTVDDNKEIYMAAWRGGCKGVTVYVDGSRDSQVLTLTAEDNVFEEETTDIKEHSSQPEITLAEKPFEESTYEGSKEVTNTEDLEVMDSRTCSIRFENGQMVKEC